MACKIDTLNLEERNLVKQAVNLLLNGKHYDEIATILGQDVEYVKDILNSKVLRKIYSATDLETILEKNKLELNFYKEKEYANYYKNLMDKIIFYMFESLYNYDEIGQILFLDRKAISNMLRNEEYIIKNYGKETYDKINDMFELRKTFTRKTKNNHVILKDPKFRQIVKKEVISVTKYQYSLIEKVSLFFEYGGNLKQMKEQKGYYLNELNASLNDKWLKEALLEEKYQQLQTLLKIDDIMTQNRIVERNAFLANVIAVVIEENGNITKIEERLGYSTKVIKRILNDSFVPIFCKNNNIDLESIKLVDDESIGTKQKIKRGI